MTKSSLTEQTLQIDPIYQGRVISLQVEHVKLPNGEVSKREVVKHPGAVAIMAIHENRMLLVEQYRKALNRTLVEIPAGKLEPNEPPQEAAIRELEEETGFRCEQVKLISSFYTSPGFADEIIHLYFTDTLQLGQSRLDDDEFLECTEVTLEEAFELIAEGRIRDAKTITAVYAWQLYKLTGQFGTLPRFAETER